MNDSPVRVPSSAHSNQRDHETDAIILYSTSWCPDCRRAKHFLNERRVAFQEVNIEENPHAEEIVLQANRGKRRVPTLKVGDRYFACSPFNPLQLSEELQIPFNL